MCMRAYRADIYRLDIVELVADKLKTFLEFIYIKAVRFYKQYLCGIWNTFPFLRLINWPTFWVSDKYEEIKLKKKTEKTEKMFY